MPMSDDVLQKKRRTYIEREVREGTAVFLRFLRQEGLSLRVSLEDLKSVALHFDGEQRGCRLEDAADTYTIGRNVGRVILSYTNPVLYANQTHQAEKVRRVVYHLFGILYVRTGEDEADIDTFPDTYPTANDGDIPFTLKETKTERMERITGKPIDIPDGVPYEDHSGQLKEFFQEEEKGLPKKDDFPDDPEVEEGLDEFEKSRRDDLEKRKEDRRYDPNQATDFGFGGDISDFGYQQSQQDEAIRNGIDAPFFDRHDASRQRRMSEEFRAARTIFLGRRDSTENWKEVLTAFLISNETGSIKFLKGIYNY